jgi:hypothetical protein
MSIHRRAAKRDTSEKAIVDYLRAAGWSVLPVSVKDGPDNFIAKHGITIAIECKTGNAKPRAGQVKWSENWQGMYYVLRNVEDAAALHRAAQPLASFKEGPCRCERRQALLERCDGE